MTSETEYRALTDEQRFELLEHPELWPEDPSIQAELAELLELHLALGSHGSALAPELAPATAPWWRRSGNAGWLAAAAAVMALVPGIYAVQRLTPGRSQATAQATLDAKARRRTQERNWADFFLQTSMVIQDFQQNPKVCSVKREDRTEEREAALVLLQASHQLASDGTLLPEAEKVRAELHAWLLELSHEDGCLQPERAEELRKWASAGKLEDQAQRMGRLLKGEAS